MKRRGRIDADTVALAGISSALGLIALVAAAYLPTAKIAMYALTGLCVALPLTRRSFVGGVCVTVVVGLLGLWATNIRVVPFAVFFGPFSLISWLCEQWFYPRATRLPKWLKIAIIVIVKVAYYFAAFFLLVAGMRIVLSDLVLFGRTWSLGVLLVLGAVVYLLYDILYRVLFTQITRFVNRYFKRRHTRNTPPDPPHENAPDDAQSSDFDPFA